MLTRAPAPGGLDGEALFAPLLPFASIGLAVSGGPDSLALMLLLAAWGGAHGKTLIVYTVDHGLRPEAAGECAMVAREAGRLGLKYRVLVWTGSKPTMGIQAAARQARYRLIGEAMRGDGCEILVTAHHQDDQAETVLMRLAHGSGIAGLSGMALFAEVEGLRLCRPLLRTAGSVLGDIVRRAGLKPVADPSNHDQAYERVRWRRLMPALAEEGLDPGRLALFATRMARAEAALDAAALAAFADLARIDGFGMLTLPDDALFALSPEIGLRLLGRAVAWAGGGVERPRLAGLEAGFAALARAAPGFASTLGGAALFRDTGAVAVFREVGRLPDGPPLGLAAGDRLVWDGRFCVACAPGLGRGLTLASAGSALTRAEAEALCGPIAAPMRAVAAAPAIRNAEGTLLVLGTFSRSGETGFAVALDFEANTGQSGQEPGTEQTI